MHTHDDIPDPFHRHLFLAPDHHHNERRTWSVIALCVIMMIVEIAGGMYFGSIALVADGLHMSTHAGALLLAALAYRYARLHADDARFTFGTGKFGDLAGFASAIVLAMIALLIGYESALRFFEPVPIRFSEAIPIAGLGLAVNIASAWLLMAGGHHAHGHGHAHHGHEHDHHDDDHAHEPCHHEDSPHDAHPHEAATLHRDNNMRAAVVHVAADAAVSVLVIVGLLLARGLGWLWMDALAGCIGALVIASWSFGLMRDTGAILLDVNPNPDLAQSLRSRIESGGDRVTDLHLWRVGPGHLAAIISVYTLSARDSNDYRSLLAEHPMLSHLTIEIERARH